MKKESLEILLEDMEEKFDLVVEGHQSLHHEIKDMRQEMDERFQLVDTMIETLNKRLITRRRGSPRRSTT